MGLGAGAMGLPAAWLLGGLAGGIAVAAGGSGSVSVPRPLTLTAQATVGVALGAQVRPEALTGLAGSWPVVLAVVALTLGVSLGVALALARLTDLGRVTAALGMLPGAAPALIAVGDEVGADARLVATMQFSRVLVVVATVPPLAVLLGAEGSASGGSGGGAAAALQGASGGAEALLVAAAVGVAGALVATVARAPAATLVGPLLLAAVLSATDLAAPLVPSTVNAAAFALIGLGVGSRFDRDSLRHAGRLAPAIAGAVVAVFAGCAALAALLLRALDTDLLTAYLATTPGGISAVLATAFDSGADLTVVIAVQTLRLILLALAAPFLARFLRADLAG